MFTHNELRHLLETEEYRIFVEACLTSRTVVFLGITADDVAVGGYLSKLHDLKIDLGTHFWITHKRDAVTEQWAEENGIQIIRYLAEGAKHSQLSEILSDLATFQPSDSSPPPVSMIGQDSAPTLRSPQELRQENSLERLREELNAYANNILTDSSKQTYEQYEDFCTKYDEAIYRAWYISTRANDNKLFGYEIQEEIAEGAYGRVFRAKRRDGVG